MAALNGDQDCLAPMVKAFRERHDYVIAELNSMPGVSCVPADGAFYAFANFQGVIGKRAGINNDIALCEYLLNEVGVALVPGSAFGSEGYARISIATSLDTLKEAMARIRKALS